MILKSYHCMLLALFSVFLFVPAAWGGGLWLYEAGTPDLGTAGAGRTALATDASTAGMNPAGMTRLDRSQMLAAVQGLYINARFDTELSGFGGGDGGNAGGFVPSGSLHYVHRVTDDFRLGITAGSYFGLGVDYGENWAGRYYATEAELLTYGVNPSAGYRVNNWLSLGAGFSILYATLDQKAAINNSAVPGQAGSPDGSVERVIANVLTDSDGIELALSTKSLATQKGNPLLEQVRRNQHVTRSGDIYIIQEPYWFLFDEGPIPAMHGSPWRYDTHVPIIFLGPGIDAQTIHRLAHPVDVAPTIAAALGMTPPASAQGSPLEEVYK